MAAKLNLNPAPAKRALKSGFPSTARKLPHYRFSPPRFVEPYGASETPLRHGRKSKAGWEGGKEQMGLCIANRPLRDKRNVTGPTERPRMESATCSVEI